MKPDIGTGSLRQQQILDVLWEAREIDPDIWISDWSISAKLGIRRATSYISPLRLKLRRLGWDIESTKRGFRIVAWK